MARTAKYPRKSDETQFITPAQHRAASPEQQAEMEADLAPEHLDALKTANRQAASRKAKADAVKSVTQSVPVSTPAAPAAAPAANAAPAGGGAAAPAVTPLVTRAPAAPKLTKSQQTAVANAQAVSAHRAIMEQVVSGGHDSDSTDHFGASIVVGRSAASRSDSTLKDVPVTKHPARALAHAESQPGVSATIFLRTGPGVGIVHELTRSSHASGKRGHFTNITSTPSTESEFMERFATPASRKGRTKSREQIQAEIRDLTSQTEQLHEDAKHNIPNSIVGLAATETEETAGRLIGQIRRDPVASADLESWHKRFFGKKNALLRENVETQWEEKPVTTKTVDAASGVETHTPVIDPKTGEPKTKWTLPSSLYEKLSRKVASAATPTRNATDPRYDALYWQAKNRRETYSRQFNTEDWAGRGSESLLDALQQAPSGRPTDDPDELANLSDSKHPLQKALGRLERHIRGITAGRDRELTPQAVKGADLSNLDEDTIRAHARATVDNHSVYATMLAELQHGHVPGGTLVHQLADLAGADVSGAEGPKAVQEAVRGVRTGRMRSASDEFPKTIYGGARGDVSTAAAPRNTGTDWKFLGKPDPSRHGVAFLKLSPEEQQQMISEAKAKEQGADSDFEGEEENQPTEMSENRPEDLDPSAKFGVGLTDDERNAVEVGARVSDDAYARMNMEEKEAYHKHSSASRKEKKARLAQKQREDERIALEQNSANQTRNEKIWHDEIRKRRAEIVSQYAEAPHVREFLGSDEKARQEAITASVGPGRHATLEALKDQLAGHAATVEAHLAGGEGAPSRAEAVEAVAAHNATANQIAGMGKNWEKAGIEGLDVPAVAHLPEIARPEATPEEKAQAESDRVAGAHAKLKSLESDLATQRNDDMAVTKLTHQIAQHKAAHPDIFGTSQRSGAAEEQARQEAESLAEDREMAKPGGTVEEQKLAADFRHIVPGLKTPEGGPVIGGWGAQSATPGSFTYRDPGKAYSDARAAAANHIDFARQNGFEGLAAFYEKSEDPTFDPDLAGEAAEKEAEEHNKAHGLSAKGGPLLPAGTSPLGSRLSGPTFQPGDPETAYHSTFRRATQAKVKRLDAALENFAVRNEHWKAQAAGNEGAKAWAEEAHRRGMDHLARATAIDPHALGTQAATLAARDPLSLEVRVGAAVNRAAGADLVHSGPPVISLEQLGIDPPEAGHGLTGADGLKWDKAVAAVSEYNDRKERARRARSVVNTRQLDTAKAPDSDRTTIDEHLEEAGVKVKDLVDSSTKAKLELLSTFGTERGKKLAQDLSNPISHATNLESSQQPEQAAPEVPEGHPLRNLIRASLEGYLNTQEQEQTRTNILNAVGNIMRASPVQGISTDISKMTTRQRGMFRRSGRDVLGQSADWQPHPTAASGATYWTGLPREHAPADAPERTPAAWEVESAQRGAAEISSNLAGESASSATETESPGRISEAVEAAVANATGTFGIRRRGRRRAAMSLHPSGQVAPGTVTPGTSEETEPAPVPRRRTGTIFQGGEPLATVERGETPAPGAGMGTARPAVLEINARPTEPEEETHGRK